MGMARRYHSPQRYMHRYFIHSCDANANTHTHTQIVAEANKNENKTSVVRSCILLFTGRLLKLLLSPEIIIENKETYRNSFLFSKITEMSGEVLIM